MKKPFFLAIVGRSGAGKTTLIEKLIPLLRQRGFSAATLKHTSHTGHRLGDEGKDSGRHFRSGAITSIFWSPEQMMIKTHVSPNVRLEKQVAPYLKNMDIVLIEGCNDSDWPEHKILVDRGAKQSQDIFTQPVQGALSAIVSDETDARFHAPQFHLDESEKIAEFIFSLMKEVEHQFVC